MQDPFRTFGLNEGTSKNHVTKKGNTREQLPWSAPAILVPKMNSDGKPKFRLMRCFSSVYRCYQVRFYPLTQFEIATSVLLGSKYFLVLDCCSGFWQVPIKKEYRIGHEIQYRLIITKLMDYI
jgi:hypothetical protein